ncbi:MAG TPA: ABC transporter permease [Gammaproteobacteria bacterium]|nr:ABC transporter permease [Gammaproteobacteria bacterium]
MSVLNQIGAVTLMNLRSIPRRMGSSSVIVIGIAGVVGVIVAVFGMTRSMSEALVDTGRPDRAIVLRSGAQNEVSSTLLVDAVATIKNAPGIARTAAGDAAASAEMLASVNLTRKENGTTAAVGVRGIEPASTTIRPEIRMIEGRMFRPGLREMIVGRGAHNEFRSAEIGDKVGLRDSQWTIVGVFESGGDANESRLLADAQTLMSAYKRTAVNAVTVLLDSEAGFDEFKTALTTNPTLTVSVERERDYYQRQSENAGTFFNLVTTFVGIIMALGALFGALNTMYSAVSARTVEIATLRAIGFGAGGVVSSVLAEALLLSLIGALLGASVAWLLFNGNTIGLGNDVGTLVFRMHMTPALLGSGVLLACVVGLLGGLLPALRAARMPVAAALRATA